ncbi:MAG: hypothetical protein QW130_00345, partial [Sulfolobales archaeon]
KRRLLQTHIPYVCSYFHLSLHGGLDVIYYRYSTILNFVEGNYRDLAKSVQACASDDYRCNKLFYIVMKVGECHYLYKVIYAGGKNSSM